MLQLLQHEDAGALAHDEAVAVAVEGAAGLVRLSLYFVLTACSTQKEASPSGVTGASVPPASITSATPSRIQRNDSPRASVAEAQAVTTV